MFRSGHLSLAKCSFAADRFWHFNSGGFPFMIYEFSSAVISSSPSSSCVYLCLCRSFLIWRQLTIHTSLCGRGLRIQSKLRRQSSETYSSAAAAPVQAYKKIKKKHVRMQTYFCLHHSLLSDCSADWLLLILLCVLLILLPLSVFSSPDLSLSLPSLSDRHHLHTSSTVCVCVCVCVA